MKSSDDCDSIKDYVQSHNSLESLLQLQKLLISAMEQVVAKLTTLSSLPSPDHDLTPPPDAEERPDR